MKFAFVLLASLILVQIAHADSNRFAETICPKPEAIAKAFLEMQMCPHAENYPFLQERPFPEAGDAESAQPAAIETTSADPGYVVDGVKQNDTSYEVKFHYLFATGAGSKVVSDSMAFKVYAGRVKNFMGCASQTAYPKRHVVRQGCTR